MSIVFFQIAYIFLQWRYIRRREYLYYIAYMISIVLYALAEFEGVLPFKLFTRFYPDFYYHARHALPLVCILLYYRFARTFLNLPDNRPKLNVWVKRLEYFILFYAILSPVLILRGMSIQMEEYIFIGVAIIMAVSTIIFIISFLSVSVPLTRFAMLGVGFLLIGSVISMILLLLMDRGSTFSFDPYFSLFAIFINRI